MVVYQNRMPVQQKALHLTALAQLQLAAGPQYGI